MSLLRTLFSLFLLSILSGCTHSQPLKPDGQSDFLQKNTHSDITSYVVINYRQLKRESKTEPGKVYTNLSHLIAKAYALTEQKAHTIVHELATQTATPAEFVNRLDARMVPAE